MSVHTTNIDIMLHKIKGVTGTKLKVIQKACKDVNIPPSKAATWRDTSSACGEFGEYVKTYKLKAERWNAYRIGQRQKGKENQA